MSSLQSGISAHKHRTSKTAALAASVRAYHHQQSKSPVFADDYAVDMVPLFWRVIAKNRLLGRFVVHIVFQLFRPVHTEVILRARYAEDRLMEAIAEGVGQYVILGAGLDTGDIWSRCRCCRAGQPYCFRLYARQASYPRGELAFCRQVGPICGSSRRTDVVCVYTRGIERGDVAHWLCRDRDHSARGSKTPLSKGQKRPGRSSTKFLLRAVWSDEVTVIAIYPAHSRKYLLISSRLSPRSSAARPSEMYSCSSACRTRPALRANSSWVNC